MDQFKKNLKKHIDMGKFYNIDSQGKFFLRDFKSGVALGALIQFLQQDNNLEQFNKLVMKNKLIIILLFCSFNIFAQQGTKGQYSATKPITVESLTKGCQLFDTFVETGGKIYYKQRTKKDGTVEDYYFTVVEKQRKDGSKYLGRKRVYLIFNSN